MKDIRFGYKVALSSILLLMVTITLTGFSYAYFSASIVAPSEIKKVTITTAEVEMNFTEGENNIHLENAYPVTDADGFAQAITAPYTFTIENPNTYAVDTQVFLSTQEGSTLDPKYVRVAYCNKATCASQADYTIKKLSEWTGTAAAVEAGTSKSYLLDNFTLTSSATAATAKKENIHLLLWMDEQAGATQITCTGDNCTTQATESMNKVFKAKISVKSIPQNTPQHLDSGDPVVTEESED